MAKTLTFAKDQDTVDIATVNGATGTGACTTVGWDIYALPNGFQFGGWQACIIACGSASLQSVTVKMLGGFDATNFMSFSSLTVSDTAFSGSQNMRLFSTELPFKYLKISLSTVSYGTCVDSLASIRVLVFGKV